MMRYKILIVWNTRSIPPVGFAHLHVIMPIYAIVTFHSLYFYPLMFPNMANFMTLTSASFTFLSSYLPPNTSCTHSMATPSPSPSIPDPVDSILIIGAGVFGRPYISLFHLSISPSISHVLVRTSCFFSPAPSLTRLSVCLIYSIDHALPPYRPGVREYEDYAPGSVSA